MISLWQAEWRKTVGNRWMVGFLLWIFPVGALGFLAFIGFLSLFFEPFRASTIRNMPLWTDAMLGVWNFPTNLFGRMFLLGLTAVVFAGEYQWGTWKNIIPRHQRTALILVKFLVVGFLVVITFFIMSLIMGVGQGILAQIVDVRYGPDPTREVVTEFLGDYGLQASLALISVMITAVYAALASMLMRSIVGGVLVGLGFSIAEPIAMFGFLGLARAFDAIEILHLARLTPTYNIDNISWWVTQDTSSGMLMPLYLQMGIQTPVDSMGFSLFALALWVGVGIGATIFIFQRQDIVS